MKPALESILREHIAASPLARLLGMRVERVEEDLVVVKLPFREEVTTVGELIHGGAISALVDVAATAAAWSKVDLERNPRGTTIGLSLNFLAAARGADIVATARVIQRGRSIVVADVQVEEPSGRAVARALVTYKLDLGG